MPLPIEYLVSKPRHINIDNILDNLLGQPSNLIEPPYLCDFLRNTSETRNSISALSALVNILNS